jgi:hypothetical protein
VHCTDVPTTIGPSVPLVPVVLPLVPWYSSEYHLVEYHTMVRTMVPVVPWYQWYHGTPVRTMVPVCVHVYVRTYTCTMVPWYTCTYIRTYNVMSQLSDWKRAHMRIEERTYEWYVRTRVPIAIDVVHLPTGMAIPWYVHVYVPWYSSTTCTWYPGTTFIPWYMYVVPCVPYTCTYL